MGDQRTTSRFSVLVADDDRDARDLMREIIEPLGYRICLASDGEEALQIVRQEIVHVALLDVNMPKLTGLEALQLLRQFNAVLPVILITAESNSALMRQALNAHAYSVIPKPVSKNIVVHTLKTALGRGYGGASSACHPV
jgi:CheY-like chemotaxis protein